MEPKRAGDDEDETVLTPAELMVHRVLCRHDGGAGDHDRCKQDIEHGVAADPLDLRERERCGSRGDDADHDGDDGVKQVVAQRLPEREARLDLIECREQKLIIVAEEAARIGIAGIRRAQHGPPNELVQDICQGAGMVRIGKRARDHPPEGVDHQEGAEQHDDVHEDIADELLTLLACAVRCGRDPEERKERAQTIAEGGILLLFLRGSVVHNFVTHVSLLLSPYSWNPARTGTSSG